jgi:hypothetical protein
MLSRPVSSVSVSMKLARDKMAERESDDKRQIFIPNSVIVFCHESRKKLIDGNLRQSSKEVRERDIAIGSQKIELPKVVEPSCCRTESVLKGKINTWPDMARTRSDRQIEARSASQSSFLFVPSSSVDAHKLRRSVVIENFPRAENLISSSGHPSAKTLL